MKNKFGRILWGLTFILLGICYGGNSFGLWNFELFFEGWWTLFIIIPCLISVVEGGFGTGNIVGLIIGLLLLLSAQGIINEEIIEKLILPTILILIGIKIVFKNKGKKNEEDYIGVNNNEEQKSDYSNMNKNNFTKYSSSNEKREEYIAIFSAREENFINEQFNGAEIFVLFAGIDLNLKNAYIDKDIIIDVSCIFGGADIIVPSNVNVKVKGTPIFGGISNETRPCLDSNAPTIYINSTCIFGGIDIK